MRPWILAETNYAHIRDHEYEVAVLPFGATEPHNLHLPYGTDIFEAGTVGELACEEAHCRGANVVLLPTLPYGTQTNMREFPLAMNLNPSTLQLVVSDLVESVADAGIFKLLLLNSHGGNEFKPVLRELMDETPVQLFLCNWYQMFDDVYDEIFDAREDHAGEMETSFALRYFPELVGKNEDGTLIADEGLARPLKFEALQKGWVQLSRPWHLLTTNAGSGNPHMATAQKGEQMMKIVVDRLATFLKELSDAELDDAFPFVESSCQYKHDVPASEQV